MIIKHSSLLWLFGVIVTWHIIFKPKKHTIGCLMPASCFLFWLHHVRLHHASRPMYSWQGQQRYVLKGCLWYSYYCFMRLQSSTFPSTFYILEIQFSQNFLHWVVLITPGLNTIKSFQEMKHKACFSLKMLGIFLSQSANMTELSQNSVLDITYLPTSVSKAFVPHVSVVPLLEPRSQMDKSGAASLSTLPGSKLLLPFVLITFLFWCFIKPN